MIKFILLEDIIFIKHGIIFSYNSAKVKIMTKQMEKLKHREVNCLMTHAIIAEEEEYHDHLTHWFPPPVK